MTDGVFITGLALHAHHGIMAHEAKVGQTFMLDLMLDLRLKIQRQVGTDAPRQRGAAERIQEGAADQCSSFHGAPE